LAVNVLSSYINGFTDIGEPDSERKGSIYIPLRLDRKWYAIDPERFKMKHQFLHPSKVSKETSI
jgi:hypothetical protein